MHEWLDEREAALAELRNRLSDGLARARLTKTQLAQQSGLSRTTVHEAIKVDGPPPSPETVAAISRVLRLPETDMQQLRRAAVEEGKYSQRANALGRPISLWNPYDLEVHPADALRDVSRSGHVEALLPAYVLRDHDQVLSAAVTDALQGRSRLLVLVGSSSTGKTRACWEAVQPLADHGWRLWHPSTPPGRMPRWRTCTGYGPRRWCG